MAQSHGVRRRGEVDVVGHVGGLVVVRGHPKSLTDPRSLRVARPQRDQPVGRDAEAQPPAERARRPRGAAPTRSFSGGVLPHVQHALALEQEGLRRAEGVEAEEVGPVAGQRGEVAAPKPRTPSMNDSSDPVEREHERAGPATGRSRQQAVRGPSSVRHAGEVVVGARGPWGAARSRLMGRRRREGEQARLRRPAGRETPVSPASAVSSGPAITGHMSGGVVSVRGSSSGKRRPTQRLGAGWEEQARVGGVVVGHDHEGSGRRPVASPGATTFHVEREGSARRRNHCASAGDVVGDPGRGGGRAHGDPRPGRAGPVRAPRAPAWAAVSRPKRPPVAAVRALLPRRGPSQPSRGAGVAAIQSAARSLAVGGGRVAGRRRGARMASCSSPTRASTGRVRADMAGLYLTLGRWPWLRTHPDCIFCKIVAGDCRPPIVDEDERTLALHGHQPGHPGPRAGDPARPRRGPPGDRPRTTAARRSRAAPRRAREGRASAPTGSTSSTRAARRRGRRCSTSTST